MVLRWKLVSLLHLAALSSWTSACAPKLADRWVQPTEASSGRALGLARSHHFGVTGVRVEGSSNPTASALAGSALRLRGGATKKKTKKGGKAKKEEEEEVEESDSAADDDDDFAFGFEEEDVTEGDFDGEGTMAARIRSAVEKTPPVTQGFLSLSIAATVGAWLLNGNRFPDFLFLDWVKVKQGQIWRLLTSFLYFGPLDISYVLTVQFVWQYMSQLEKVHHKEPEQFVIMWLMGASLLVGAFAATGLPTANLGHNLSCFLVYVWARTYEGHDINFMEMFTMRSELMPWFLALQTFLLEGEFPLMDLVGIAVGHVYYVLYSAKVINLTLF